MIGVTEACRRPVVPVRRGSGTVLVVDDDATILAGLTRELGVAGFRVATARSGREALDRVEELPELAAAVLDVGMRDLSGYEVCARWRAGGHAMPVLMLSARREVADRVAGLDAGADDYLGKPFAVEELVARLRALLRRGREVVAVGEVTVGDLVVDRARRQARHGPSDLPLTRREFDLLEVLTRHAGQVLPRQRLLELVWGYSWGADSNVVDVFVSSLRRKLEAGGRPRVLHTVRGVGFVLREAGRA